MTTCFVPSLTEEELIKVYHLWLAANGNGRSKQDLRFGQWLCINYLNPGVVSFPTLFYAEKATEAYDIAAQALR